ncbi:hypothetical protein EFA46_005325 [Halarchaeum sp. CBA1220]|uniref:hypothetical protein n=1 Tax=Halarchaeum sp. CBA1220 TaxID=1853682 RepID=UPI000F3A924D|nr:hypothetical protein [Halarchaeum sp. CBA1220]QLC33643.1 hypothetical protein EFA46_005325 [Halarchaeum sp. CBA1220]
MTDTDPDPTLWEGALASGVLLVVVAVVGEPEGVALLGALLPIACVAWVRTDRERTTRKDVRTDGRRDVGGLTAAEGGDRS